MNLAIWRIFAWQFGAILLGNLAIKNEVAY